MIGAMGRSPYLPRPVLVAAWLWIGAGCLMLLVLRSLLPGTERELILWWRWRILWDEPSSLGIPLWRAWLDVNILFALMLWLEARSHRLNVADRFLTLVANLGTAALLLLLHWAFVTADSPLPQWQLQQIYP